MKLLHGFFRLRLADLRAASVSGGTMPPGLNVTVPAPLADADSDHAVCAASTQTLRREPASFLKAARHRRRGSGR